MTGEERYLVATTPDARLNIWEFEESERIYERGLFLSRSGSHFEAQQRKERFGQELETARAKLSDHDLAGALHHLEVARRVVGYGREPEALELQAELTRLVPRAKLKTMWERRAFPDVDFGEHYVLAPQQLRVAYVEGDRVKTFEASDGSAGPSLKGHEQAITRLAISYSGNLIISACDEPSLRLWTLHNNRCHLLTPPEQNAGFDHHLGGRVSRPGHHPQRASGL